jgi:O-antigen ligase
VSLAEAAQSLGKRSKLLLIPMLLLLVRDRKEAMLAMGAFFIAQFFLLASSWLLVLHIHIPWAKVPEFDTDYAVFSTYLDQSIMSCVVAALCWHLRELTQSPSLRVIALGTVILALTNAVFAMQGRTGHMVAIVLITLAVMWALPARWRIGALLAPLLLVLGMYATSSRFHDRFNAVATETSAFSDAGNSQTPSGERLNYWHRSLQAIAERPLYGFGVGSWNAQYRRLDAGRGAPHTLQIRNPHQEFLLWGVEAGLGGIVLLCYLMFAACKDAMSMAPPIRHAVHSVVAALVVACCFNSSLFDGAIGDFFCVTLGLLLALGWQTKQQAFPISGANTTP